ncbi:DUF6807 family protein [Arthrobacter sp. B1805]|uniref:DUF6807 family protein n=1 Tax=Arthrobacter sp. B1805 TaxID=2058892 RepID=UPI0015E3AB83|nr:DUF6807 family protein [Arthrobacter sp. B1805]
MTSSAPLTTADGRPAGILHDGGGEPPVHSPRPFMYPVTTPSGRNVADYRPADHPWHWGLGIAISNITVDAQQHPVNLWGGPTYQAGQGYVQLPNNGTQRVVGSRHGPAGTEQQLEWRAADGKPILVEERTWTADTVQAGDAEWFRTSVRSRWTNTSGGPLAFGSPTTAGRPNAGYGGFFLRLPVSFDGASIIAPPVGQDVGTPPVGQGVGAGTVSEEEAMGSERSWLALRANEASVLMVAATDNPGAPTPWFVRTAGTPMLCAAPFFHTEMRLGANEAAEWGWSLLVADGRVQDAAIGEAAEAEGAEGAAGAVQP